MAKWVYTLQLTKEWKAAADNLIGVEEMAHCVGKSIREMLERMPELESVVIDDIATDFEGFEGSDVEEFDHSWERLYNWADWNRVWVEIRRETP